MLVLLFASDTFHQDAILQLIKLKSSFPDINLVIYGASEASSVRFLVPLLFSIHLTQPSQIPSELIPPTVPLILIPRPAATTFETVSTLPFPPLSPSLLSLLLSTNSSSPPPIALGSPGDAELHSLALEASWAGKFAGLQRSESLALVSSVVESILGLPKNEDVVVWEGEPGEFGAGVVLILSGHDDMIGIEESGCWPESQ